MQAAANVSSAVLLLGLFVAILDIHLAPFEPAATDDLMVAIVAKDRDILYNAHHTRNLLHLLLLLQCFLRRLVVRRI